MSFCCSFLASKLGIFISAEMCLCGDRMISQFLGGCIHLDGIAGAGVRRNVGALRVKREGCARQPRGGERGRLACAGWWGPGGGGPGRSHSRGDPERTLVLLHHVLHPVWPIHPPDQLFQAVDKISLGFLNSFPNDSSPAMCSLAAG